MRRDGFTLIELLITLVVLGLLATIAWLRMSGLTEETYRTSIQTDLHSVALAQELYYQTNLAYGDVEQLEAYVPTDGVIVTVTHASNTGFAATAVHSGLSGVTCGYYRGSVPAGAAAPAESPDVVACD